MDSKFDILKRLDATDRRKARDNARNELKHTIGKRPRWQDYKDDAVGEYPSWLAYMTGALMMIVLFAAANVTVFRVFTAGRDHFAASIGIGWQASIVGIAAFVLSEFTVIVSVIAKRIYFGERGGGGFMYVPIVAGLAMAFVGNAVVSNPDFSFGTWGSLWSILETFVPPIAVLFMSLIGEQLLLHNLKQRHANRKLFEEALHDWQHDFDNLEQHDGWGQAFANSLWDMIVAVNDNGRGKTERMELLNSIDDYDRVALVLREMSADQWFSAEVVEQVNPTSPASDQEPMGGQKSQQQLPSLQPAFSMRKTNSDSQEKS